jgi:hypothetical protein
LLRVRGALDGNLSEPIGATPPEAIRPFRVLFLATDGTVDCACPLPLRRIGADPGTASDHGDRRARSTFCLYHNSS